MGFWIEKDLMAIAERSRQCMAACAGIEEPEKAIPALLAALRTMWDYEHSYNCEYFAHCTTACKEGRAALALVQPQPVVQAAKSTPILDAIKTVREQELHRAAQAEAAMANDPDLEGHIEEEEP